jgi:hypothetical protein
MLPITQQDVEKALDEIDTDGVPRKYLSRLYCLVARQDRHYPPKQVLRLAYRHSTGTVLARSHGGEPTNKPLRELGYSIERCVRVPECQTAIATEP